MNNSVFGFEQPEASPGFLLWQATITWQRMIKKALDPYGISHAQFVIMAISLWLEHQAQEINQTFIIRQSKLDKMTVSKSLKKLVSDGYVKRTEHKQDTRAKTVFLTKKGKELTEKLVPIIENIDDQFFGSIKETEQKTLTNLLNQLVIKADT